MHIQDQIIAGIESPRHTLRLNQYRRVRFPKQKIAVGIELVSRIYFQLHPGNAGLSIPQDVRGETKLCDR